MLLNEFLLITYINFKTFSQRLFYQYCNGNAPYNDKLFVFLVTVEKCTEGTEVKQIEEVNIQSELWWDQGMQQTIGSNSNSSE